MGMCAYMTHGVEDGCACASPKCWQSCVGVTQGAGPTALLAVLHSSPFDKSVLGWGGGCGMAAGRKEGC
jgi:hypothetical protein